MTREKISFCLAERLTRVGALLLFTFLPHVRAQNARLTGTITDASARTIPGAAVSIRNEQTGVHRETISTDTGVYDVPALIPGRYVIRVTKPGFETVEQSGVTVTVDAELRVDFSMKVGGVAEIVTVNEDAALLQQNSAEAATTITSQQYDDLPLVQQGRIRSPAAFIFLAPSVQGNYTVAGAENTSATNQFVVNGSQMQVSEFYVQGVEAGQMRTVGSLNESAPPVDAVGEFKIITTLLPAEYGHSGAAAGIFSIKSGINQYHGSAYEYFRNNVLDAEPFGTVQSVYTRQNEFGATLGGPLSVPRIYNGHNRSFFFFAYGGSRKSGADAVQRLRVATPQQISGNFDPSKYNLVFDPATTQLNPAGTGYTRTPFPGNIIPASRIDPIAAKITGYLPAPNIPGAGTQDYQGFSGERLLNPDTWTFKLDHQFSDAHHVSATYIGTDNPRDKVGTSLPFPLRSDSYQITRGTTARLSYDWIIGANRVNSLTLGFNRFENVETPPNGDQFGIGGLPSSALPSFAFNQSYAPFANDGAFNDTENNFQIKDAFSWTVSSHTIRFGGELRRIQFNDVSPTPATAALSISNLETANPTNLNGTGDAFASFLLGQVDSATVASPYEIATRYKYFGAFIQDDWKVTRRLTLNLGLRWEFQTVPTENAGHNSIVSLTTQNPSAGNLPGAMIYASSGNTAFASSDYSAISPRFGLAYQFEKNSVLRAGVGLFYANTNLSIVSSGFQSQGSVQSPDGGMHPAFVLINGVPQIASLQPSLTPGLLNGQNATYLGADAGRMPRITEWMLGVQHMFGRNWLVEANYVGNHGTRLVDPQAVNINQLAPQYLSLGSLLTVPATSAAAQAAGIQIPYTGFTGTVLQALRPYPQYLTLTSLAAKAGYNNYNALQIVLRKRYSFGLTTGANYTWSKNLGISSPGTYGGGVVDNTLQNAYAPAAEYSYLSIDVPQAVTLHYTYELPFGEGRRWLNQKNVLSAVAGGWMLSGVHRYQNGFPLPILTNNALAIGNRILRPNLVPGVDPSTGLSVGDFNQGISRLINLAAFSQPAAYTFGNAAPAYNDVRNFPIFNEDLSAVKVVRIRERVTLNIYGQFFNAFNRHRFTSIDSNFHDATFGQPSSVSQPRLVQLGMRIQF